MTRNMARTFLAACLVAALALPAVAAEKLNKAAIEAAAQAYGTIGMKLPYTVLRADLADGLNPERSVEIRNGGFGSAMTAHPHVANMFYALTDRGPNATFKKGAYGKGKTFPTPDYTPRIGQFSVAADGTVTLVRTILLRRPDGTRITGLPNSSDLGGTGETPYFASGAPILVDNTKPYDKRTNPLKLDDYGLDGEGLAALSDGSFWVSDEYGPHMVHFDATGREIGRINPFAGDTRNILTLPAEFANRRPNRGMEGLAITPYESTLVGIMQSTMFNPNKKVKNLDVTRIVTVNLYTGKISQYLYKQEKPANSNSEIVALTDTRFLVIERDGKFLAKDPKAQKHVYAIDLSTGTDLETVTAEGTRQDDELGLLIGKNTIEQAVLDGGWDALAAKGIQPVQKSLVVDMVQAVNYPHDKMEGLWVIDGETLGVLNDDDFATWSTKGKVHQKLLDGATEDGNTLYIVKTKL